MIKDLEKIANALDNSGYFQLASQADQALQVLAQPNPLQPILQNTQSHISTAYNAIRQMKQVVDKAAQTEAQRFTDQQLDILAQNMRALANASYQLQQVLQVR